MRTNALNGWVKSIFKRRGRSPIRRPAPTRLRLEQFEARDCPSASILLNHVDPTTQLPLVPTWTPMGPAPELNGGVPGGGATSGRISGVTVDPANPNRIFVTAASGGVWRTLDGGQTWKALTLHLPDNSPGTPTNITSDAVRTLKMGAIAIAPSNPNIIYAAEGEGDTSTSGFGVLKSTDGGDTWTLLGNSTLNLLSAKSIAVDNLDPNIVYVNGESLDSAVFPPDPRPNGVFRTLDGGLTWDNITASSPVLASAFLFTDVDLVPRTSLNQPDILYCTVSDTGLDAGIYKSINANDPTATNVTWNLAIGGSTLVPGAGPGDIQMVVSPQFPSVLYATIADNNNALLGVYRSTDAGVNWVRILAGPNYLGTQADYDNVINVSPFNPNVVIVAGQGQVLFSNNAEAANPNSVVFTDVSVVANTGPHVDSHASAFDSSGNFIIGDDGGLYRLEINNFTTPQRWDDLNGDNSSSPVITALNTIQFNSVALDPRDANLALGGAQDNGTSRFNDNVGWTGTDTFADGGNVIIDYNNPLRAVHVVESLLANVVRFSDDGGVTWADATMQPAHTPQNTLFYPPLLEDPSLSARFYFGSDQLAISEDGGVTWGTTYSFPTGKQTVPGDPSTGIPPAMGGPFPITAIGVGRASGAAAVLYAAHTDGTLYQLIFGPPPNPAPTTMDWINIAPSGTASVGVITQIIVDPQNPQDVYVVGTGGVARTQDALELGFTGLLPTWIKISGNPLTGGLPASFGAETLALDPKNFTDTTDDVLYVGGDFGVYQLTNPGHPGPGQPGGTDFVWSKVGSPYDSD
ncbi:MAG TPA: hypothetical protein VH120_06385, partial [Gemmataceae bacterium]|nr:hypothetical protein [Gemmataceae bacterium]